MLICQSIHAALSGFLGAMTAGKVFSVGVSVVCIELGYCGQRIDLAGGDNDSRTSVLFVSITALCTRAPDRDDSVYVGFVFHRAAESAVAHCLAWRLYRIHLTCICIDTAMVVLRKLCTGGQLLWLRMLVNRRHNYRVSTDSVFPTVLINLCSLTSSSTDGRNLVFTVVVVVMNLVVLCKLDLIPIVRN